MSGTPRKRRYVTEEQCKQVSADLAQNLGEIKGLQQANGQKLDEIKEALVRDHDTLYGRLEHGVQKGGVVTLLGEVRESVRRIEKNGHSGLTGRQRIVLYGTAMTSATTILVEVIRFIATRGP